MIFDRSAPVADELRVQLEKEQQRTADLVRTIVEMRREGFQMPPESPPLEIEDIGLPNEVVDAVEARAMNRQAREKLMIEARRLLRDSDPESVAEHILSGERFAWGA